MMTMLRPWYRKRGWQWLRQGFGCTRAGLGVALLTREGSARPGAAVEEAGVPIVFRRWQCCSSRGDPAGGRSGKGEAMTGGGWRRDV